MGFNSAFKGLNPVKLGQGVMRKSADFTAAITTENKTRVEAVVLDNSRVTVSELEHDLDLSHGTIVRLFRS